MYFNTLNATGELYKIKESPKLTAAVWAINPVHNPQAKIIPAFFPRVILCVITNKISGPGIKVNKMAALKKPSIFT